MIICTDCGWTNRDGALFCAHCGGDLARTSADAAAVAPDADPIPTAPLPEGQPTRLLTAPEAPDAAPLTVGAVLQQRFQIVEQLEDRPEVRVYRAIDLERCAVCGAVGAGGEDGYCQACGAARATPCFVRLTEQWRHEPPAHDEHLALPDRDYQFGPVSSSGSCQACGRF